jgi:uncharacterized membrane protein
MIYIILIISILINALLIWYGYKLIKKALAYSENIYFLMDDVEDFAVHLESIYEQATFYGDASLHSLLLHSKNVKENIENFKKDCTLELEDEEEWDEYKESEETSGSQREG